jgi:hypothetical protein
MIIFSSIRTVNNKEISTSLKFDETSEKGLLTISSDSENHEISVKRALIKNDQIRNKTIAAFGNDKSYGYTYHFINSATVGSMNYEILRKTINQIVEAIATGLNNTPIQMIVNVAYEKSPE